MSFGYENILRFPPYSDHARAISAEWPNSPWIARPARGDRGESV